MCISDQEPMRAIEHPHQKMMVLVHAIRKVGGIVQDRIDFSTDRGLGMI
jgi:hypothetical protein